MPFVGRDVITQLAELMKTKVEIKQTECASGLLVSQCGHAQDNFNKLMIWGFIAKCFQQHLKISIGPVYQESGDKDIEQWSKQLMNE